MSENAESKTRVTAGLRGASWNPALLPPAMRTSVHALRTEDGAAVVGYLHAIGGESTVVFIMHPRELLVSHYLVPYLVSAGFACWVQGPRTVGNDLRLEHEFAVLDVAAGLVKLRELGFADVVMLGNSGGASLFAFYNQQSLLAPERRIAKTPAGRPTGLGKASLPEATGFILIAPHPGQGQLLLNLIDPSVTDEADPFSVDPALDPFSPANGYAATGASYSAEFLERYRAAQLRRVQKIDDAALAMVTERQTARAKLKEGDLSARRAAAFSGVFEIWRTDADPRCFDLSLDPSDRRFGTVWGADPIASNLGSVGFARVCTPESWLSTWSGLSSNASFAKSGGQMRQPVLMIEYTGDNTVFPSDNDKIFASIASAAKSRHRVRGNHHGQALAEGDPLGQDISGGLVVEWLRAAR